ncbi:MAG: (d)CMP kinase [Rhodospirillaceae bacterium]|jgi:CMP/dCMP kinase|nr:(d)CMP kinase [Rhodospirillaceae bacterium]
MIIAIDGPAASGKGTVAKRLAAHFAYPHLDTGALYRAVGLTVLRQGLDPNDAAAATEAARGLDPAIIDDPEIRSGEAGAAASKVAIVGAVREALLAFQRDFAARPPGAVLDGRDIATVICPGAERKIFVTASVEERANRRLKELLGRGEAAIYARVLADLRERDARDAGREDAPMIQAADAYLLDTTTLDADQAFAKALAFVTDGTR